MLVNVFSLFANSDINCTLCFCFFVLSPWMLQLIIKHKLVCPRKLELDSSPTSCCSIVVVHCASLPIKKYIHSKLCPFVSFAGTHPVYYGVGLRWDDDAGKSRIMCLWCTNLLFVSKSSFCYPQNHSPVSLSLHCQSTILFATLTACFTTVPCAWYL